MVAVLALSGGRAHAAVGVQLSPSLNAPQPVGTTVTWTASATDTNPGALYYQFSVRLSGGEYAVVRDFALSNSFEWTPSEREGSFDVRVVARNASTLEATQLAVSYAVSPRVTGESPVISRTANPLVALYSAPPCAAGSMRVRFWRTGDFTSQSTPWKGCLPGVSRNFYVAGMLPVTEYSMRHEVSTDPEAPVTTGPTLSFLNGSPPPGFAAPAASVVTPSAGDSGQEVLFHSHLNRPSLPFITATNLGGGLLWYYGRRVQYATRLVEGGTVLVIMDSAGGSLNTLREIDLADNTVRETSLKAVSDQLVALGANPINSFHHEARRLPDGRTVLLAGTERVMSDVQGPGPVAIVGDMIVVLDENWQVVWYWDSFDHLDVTRKALLDEKCPQLCFTTSATANDWTHANAVAYSPFDGSLLLSVRHQDWVVKIDFRDGDGDGTVLWKLGKDGDLTYDTADPYPWFSHQHDADFLPGQPGALSVFDNGNLRQPVPGVTHNSRGQVLNIDEAGRRVTFQLNADLGGYSFAFGSAQTLTGGNFHFLSGGLPTGNGRSIETRPDGSSAFTLQTQGFTYRSFRMRDLYTPGAPGGVDQSIGFGAIAAQAYGATLDLSATASSGLPVSFRLVSGPATLSGNTLTFTGTGTVVVQADQDGNIKYNPARGVRQTFAVNRANQTITFEALADKTFGDAPFAPVAAASSGLAVGFAAEGHCTFNGSAVNITGAGSCTVTASQAGDANFNAAAPVQRSFTIHKAGSTTVVMVGDATYDGLTHGGTAAVTGVGGLSQSLAVTYAGRNATAYGPSTTAPTSAGDYTASASFGGDANHAGSNDSKNFQIAKAGQTVTFDALSNKTFGAPDFALSASTSSGLAAVFSASENCAVSGSTVHITGAGLCKLTASQPGDANYNPAAPVERSFTIARAGQTITFDALVDKTFGAPDFTLSATASSGLGVSFTASGRCSVSGNSVHITGAGSCTVTAAQAGGANYEAAPNVSRQFNINKAGSTTTVSVGDATYDGQPHGGSASVTGFGGLNQSLTVTYAGRNATAYGPSTTAPTNAGDYTASAGYADGSDHADSSDSKNFQIAKAGQTVTFDALSNKTFGAPDFALSASTSSGLAAVFSASENCAVSGSTVHITGAGLCKLTASQPGDANYNPAAPVERSFTIARAGQTITFDALPNKTYGEAPFDVSAAGGASGKPVTFSASGNCEAGGANGGTITINGAGSCTVTASQAGDDNYMAAADIARSFSVAKASQSINITTHAPASAAYDSQFTVAANGGGSGNPVTYAGTGSCSNSGTAFTMTSGTGACTVTYSQAGDDNYLSAQATETVNADKGAQTINFPAPVDKTYGDADFALDASVSSGLSPSFNAEGACTVAGQTVHITGAGSCTVTASQAGDDNYSAAGEVARTFSISKAATTTALSSSSNPSGSGQGLTFTATVISPAGTPDGQVQFKVNGESLGDPVPLNAGGVAALTTSALGAGSYTVTAEYGGGANFDASSGALSGAQAVGGLFEFSLPLYSVAERAGSFTVTVRRTGDVSTAASVDYATDDGSIPAVSVPCSSVTGLALLRCDYTGAAGTLHFAAGEAEKTFVVLVNDDSFVEGTETTRLRLSGASGGTALGSLPSAELEITDDQPESAGNPSDDDEAFVRQHYHDFLGREPDAEGLKFWADGIRSCGPDGGCRAVKRVHTSAAFFLSIEFQNTGFFAYRMHKAASGDLDGSPVPVSFEDFIADTRALGLEVVVGQTGWEQRLAANKAAYALRFVRRPEFLARYPAQTAASSFVHLLNANVGGVLTDAERSALVSELSPNPADAALRASVLRKVAENAQFAQAGTDRAFVLMQYFGYLRRDPDDAPDSDFTGYNFWLAKLREFGGDYIAAEMVKAFISSDEYRKRFGQ